MTYDKASFLAGLRTGLALPRVPKEKPTPPSAYLTFASEDSSNFTLSVDNSTKNWDGTLCYSTDTTNWTVWDGTTVLNSNNGVLYLRGSGNSIIAGSSNEKRWILTQNKRISCIGNIENLLDWETVIAGQHPQMTSNCYANMFYRCTSLTSAPELPAITLVDHCYYHMFYRCTSLTSAPELPATSLSHYCYYGMFLGCTSLTSAPKLPATKLDADCYNGMFYGCTGLTSAPKLPATILDVACYNYMFYGCVSLTSAPELPATVLRTSCYNYMFSGCTSLKLSTTQDTTYQYPYRIPSSGNGATATKALSNMFANTGGTFTGTPSINTTYYTDHPPIPAT